MNRWFYLLLAVLVVLIAYFGHRHAYSHEAPSGWKYPQDCCSEQHCRPVSCDALVETHDGIRFLDLMFNGGQIKASGDNSCHVCIGYSAHNSGKTTRNPICVFVKPET